MHGYRAVFDSTRTCLVPGESTSPPSHRQGGNYHIEIVKWPEEESEEGRLSL